MKPVRVKYGASETFSPGGGVTGVQSTKVSVKVENIATVKDVAIHYQQTDGTWTDATLITQKHFGDYDLFFENFSTFETNQFVIRYFVNGQTFWDNNNGADYRFDSNRRGAVGGNVILNLAIAKRGSQAGGGMVVTTSWIEGEIFVSNLSYNKNVGIRWTLNDWTTFEDAKATYSGAVPMYAFSSGVEVWKFKTPEYNLSNSNTPNFKFAVFYRNLDNDASFWDNNFNHDYTLSKVDGTTVE
jgi:hypothetical protein